MEKPEKRSIKEKWNDHWNNRKFAPPQEQANLAGVCFFWVFTTTLMLTTLLLAIPHHYRNNENSKLWATGLIFFIFIESTVNWVLCLITKNVIPTNTDVGRTTEIPEGWKNCLICQQNIPPRAHHCKICQKCVLKRDHHCFFTGVCIGFYNQRNFIVYTFYMLVGNVYGIYLVSHYLGQFYDVWSPDGWTFLPFVAFWKFVFGNLPTAHLLLMGQMYICIGLAIVAAYFFFFQLAVVLSGRTTYEAIKCIKKYQGKDVLGNIRDVMGPFWPIQFILPIQTALPGDGIHWNTDNSSKYS